jgi:hypothetical protein
LEPPGFNTDYEDENLVATSACKWVKLCRYSWERLRGLRAEQKKKELVGRTPAQRAAVERILDAAAKPAAAILGLSVGATLRALCR